MTSTSSLRQIRESNLQRAKNNFRAKPQSRKEKTEQKAFTIFGSLRAFAA
jgi:hypothetical protein